MGAWLVLQPWHGKLEGAPALQRGPLKGSALLRAEKQRLFLRAYVKSGTIRDGAIAARVSRQAHYNWLAEHEDYRLAFEAAKEECIEGLEAEARKRALGHSDVLLIFLLKANRPNMYRDRWEGKLDTTSIIAPMTPAMLKHMSSDELEQARGAVPQDARPVRQGVDQDTERSLRLFENGSIVISIISMWEAYAEGWSNAWNRMTSWRRSVATMAVSD